MRAFNKINVPYQVLEIQLRSHFEFDNYQINEAGGNSFRVQIKTMVCFVRGLDSEDNAAIADGHGSQWQQKAEGEVISSLLANEPLVVLIGPAWRTIWNRNSWSGVEDY